MDIWKTIDDIVLVILGSVGLFVVCCAWCLCEEEIKAWWRRRRGKGD